MEALCLITESLQNHNIFHPSFHKGLSPHPNLAAFCVGDQHFRFRILPVRVSSAPRVFSKVLINLVVHLREQGIYFHPYLDNLLIWSCSRTKLIQDTEKTIQCLQKYRFIVNFQKSSLEATQCLEHLGVIKGTTTNCLYLPQKKAKKWSVCISDQEQIVSSNDVCQTNGSVDFDHRCRSVVKASHKMTPTVTETITASDIQKERSSQHNYQPTFWNFESYTLPLFASVPRYSVSISTDKNGQHNSQQTRGIQIVDATKGGAQNIAVGRAEPCINKSRLVNI